MVCNTSGKVNITLRAYRENSRLNIEVENDIPSVGERKYRPLGMGIGLRNVAQRLSARFQGDSEFSSGAVAPNRYRACINMPWRIA